jgi:hypothetical protein
MASKKKKLGSLGPQPHWLRMSVAERAKTKQYIKEGLLGYTRPDGVDIPGARRIYRGLESASGYDLRHIERWSAAKLKAARRHIQALNTLTARPFDVIVPRSAKQRKEAQKFTGQNLPNQKEMIVAVQIPGRDKAIFRNGKIAIERKFPSGSKTIKQRFLFADYLHPDESLRERIEEETGEELDDETLEAPSTFREMHEVTKRMLLDMPKNVYGQPAFYTLLTRQYGPIGRSATHGKVMDLLASYFNRYDPGGTLYRGHEDFVEQVIGYQMIGTFAQMSQYQIVREQRALQRKRKNKLRFSQKVVRCPVIRSDGKRCKKRANHKDPHKF